MQHLSRRSCPTEWACLTPSCPSISLELGSRLDWTGCNSPKPRASTVPLSRGKPQAKRIRNLVKWDFHRISPAARLTVISLSKSWKSTSYGYLAVTSRLCNGICNYTYFTWPLIELTVDPTIVTEQVKISTSINDHESALFSKSSNSRRLAQSFLDSDRYSITGARDLTA